MYQNFMKTREECKKIVASSEAFYCTTTEVHGFKVEMYDYRLASYMDFVEHEAYELRGLTFVYNPVNDEWERHLALNKFFNINQTTNWMYQDVYDKKIVAVADKCDGSMITFVKLPNGTVVAKSKMSFISEQARMAQELYSKDLTLQLYIKNLLDYNCIPIFELVSPHNQIVLNYNSTELRLLQIRYNKDFEEIKAGDYYDTDTLFLDGVKIKITDQLDSSYYNLDKLLYLKTIETDIEGYVGMFDDGQMFKIKTDWYLQLHGLVTDKLRENLLIKTILDENIDDVLSQVIPGEKRDFIIATTNKVTHKFNHLVIQFETLRDKYVNECKSDRKMFAMKYSKEPIFSEVMKSLVNDIENIEVFAKTAVTNHILKKTYSLKDAKEWINS